MKKAQLTNRWKKMGKKAPAFTLIELLISISIFMGFMIVASNAYIEIIRAQKTANETRLIYSEMRNFIDLLNNELREGTVDYFCYNQGFLNNPDFTSVALTRCYDGSSLVVDSGNNLRTISRDGLSSSIIKFVPQTEDGTGGHICQKKFRNVNGSWGLEAGFEGDGGSGSPCGDYKELAFGNLLIKNLKLEIYPKADPASADAANLATQLQPMVRLGMEVGSKLRNVKFDMQFQTSITARN